jgi:hypothetical protein
VRHDGRGETGVETRRDGVNESKRDSELLYDQDDMLDWR